ncbi:hypothetical protein Bbelb_053870 [Branchiostoma belcheri]|nr:hypothetical protein Bbelb_053870 [Branchiostoma belcheri]
MGNISTNSDKRTRSTSKDGVQRVRDAVSAIGFPSKYAPYGGFAVTGCICFRVTSSDVITRRRAAAKPRAVVTLYEYTFTYLIGLEEAPGTINNTSLPKRTPSLQDTVPNMAKLRRYILVRLGRTLVGLALRSGAATPHCA